MKINKARYTVYIANDREFEIKYHTRYSSGVIVVDSKYYQDYLKKFTKVLKDCVIDSMTERSKEE